MINHIENQISILGIIIVLLIIINIMYPLIMLIITSRINRKISNIEDLLINQNNLKDIEISRLETLIREQKKTNKSPFYFDIMLTSFRTIYIYRVFWWY